MTWSLVPAYPKGATIRGSQTDANEHPLCRARNCVPYDMRYDAIKVLYRDIASEDFACFAYSRCDVKNSYDIAMTRHDLIKSHERTVCLAYLGSTCRELRPEMVYALYLLITRGFF